MEQRALQRFMYEEARKQNNIESITIQSLPQLDGDAKPEEIEEDWLTNFFDKCRLVSDQEMQAIWARILAGEANTPGTFSKRTVSFLESLEKWEAQIFMELCAFNWTISDRMLGGTQPMVYDMDAEIYTERGINFDMLRHLDAIGLISLGGVTGYELKGLAQTIEVSYQGASFSLRFTKKANNKISLGKVLLTTIGEELINVCAPESVVGFEEYIINKWKKEGIQVTSL